MSMCKLHSEFYRQQAKLDALLTRRCHIITEGKNGEGATPSRRPGAGCTLPMACATLRRACAM